MVTHMNSTTAQALAKLDEFAELQPGWNGYDAQPLSPAVLVNAKAIVNALSPAPAVFPTANDSVQLEYTKPDDDYLELEVTTDTVYAYYAPAHGTSADDREWTVPLSPTAVADVVAAFFADRVPCTLQDKEVV